MVKAKIRGIYSTALTKLLLDNGFEIVQPSLTIKNRFGLPENSAQPDIQIKDRYDLQGVRVLGEHTAVNIFQSIMHSSFIDVLTRRWSVSVDGIYKGNVIAIDDAAYVDIGGAVGKLPRFEIVNLDQSQVIVQVERKRIGAKQPVLTTKLKIVGNYAILVQGCKVGVSLKINDLRRRNELHKLGKELAPNGWGIIWRESSANQPTEALKKEVEILSEKIKTLKEKALNSAAPTLLIDGSYFMDVEFPCFSKKKLDALRVSVAPTLDGHHFYKGCGGKISAALDMAEKLLEKGESKNKVLELFKIKTAYEFPEIGSKVDIEHVKLSGIILNLGRATIESLDDENIKYSRIIKSNGFYDCLGVDKKAGDKAISETKFGELYIKTEYFSSSGEWKGTYINLNTPIEVYPNAIRYVDLEVDVCIQPNGVVKIVDMEKLEKALSKGIINQNFFEMIKRKVEEIEKSIDF
ncbi:MAG: ribonuclease E/G [Candidatus Bathyarchaeia archaeon]